MRKILLISLILILAILLLNVEVSTRQGINYRVQEIRIPLYLKLMDFFDRDFNYRQLVKGIVKGSKSEEERVIRIFTWTCENIRKQPEGMPVVDDHVWHIIVRGYGEIDQSSDVFTTLCNYAGFRAFYALAHSQDQKNLLPLSFVKIRNKWVIFDPYRKVYFKDRNGAIADIEALKNNNWVIHTWGEQPDINYSPYLKELPSVIEASLARASIQSPLNRLLFEIKKRMRLKTGR